MLKQLLTAALLFATVTSMAQVSHEKRIEISLEDEFQGESLKPFGENGFIIQTRSKKSDRNQYEWKYEFYNNELEKESEEIIRLDSKFRKINSEETDTHLHGVFRHKNGELVIVSVDMETNEIIETRGTISSKVYLKGMTVLDDFCIFTAATKKEHLIYVVNWKTGKADFHPISLNTVKAKNIKITRVQALEEAKEVLVYLKVKISKETSKTYVLRFDDEGERTDMFEIESESGKNIVAISGTKIDENEYIFTGTYSLNSSTTSQGIFFLQRFNGQTGFVNFVRYTELENFLSYLSEKRQEKIKKKEEKKAKKGKELVLNYLIADHEIIKIGDEYVFLGEAYYPTYRTERTTSTVNGVTTTTTRQVFDGYQYTHGFVVKFDNTGEFLWDKTFEMYLYQKPFFVKRFISVAEQNESSMKMVYANSGGIYSKTIDYDLGEIENEASVDFIETGDDEDKTKYTISNIEYWYDNFYISYGVQKIKNKSADDKKRKVYFVSKVAY